MRDPSLIPVRPRVIAERSRGVVLLEDLVDEMLANGDVSLLGVYGNRGAGLTTTLRYLQQLFGRWKQVDCMDAETTHLSTGRVRLGWIRFPQKGTNQLVLKCQLAPWTNDELIEYTLANHRDRCASVMRRVHKDPQLDSLEGNPNICSQVLDHLAADESLPDITAALNRIIELQFPDAHHRDQLAEQHFRAVVGLGINPLTIDAHTDEQERLLHIPAIKTLMATTGAWAGLRLGDPDLLRNPWPRKLLEEVGPLVRESVPIQDLLRGHLTQKNYQSHPMVVSLLHAAGKPWNFIPTRFFNLFPTRLNLFHAVLDGADCSEMNLARCDLSRGSFESTKFISGDLRYVRAAYATFDQACFSNAKLSGFNGGQASFSGSDLKDVIAHKANFQRTKFDGADLSDADLSKSDFRSASLRQCSFRNSDLSGCNFECAGIEEADFTRANLTKVSFRSLDLSVAEFEGASFRRARLDRCGLEGMELPNADFYGASLRGAIFTDSTMPHANFTVASLRHAKLANVDWEFANLREADMTGATFHMGSSRSGLVGSSIPMHGSRTGFYTDESQEQDYKSPEEIRKANLRGADLRGAIIDKVDFYLVDLRDALFDPEQEEQLRRTGAILLAPA